MKRAFKILWRSVKWCFIVLSLLFLLAVVLLSVRQQRIPMAIVEAVFAHYAPANLVFYADSVAFGLRHGLSVRGLQLYDREQKACLDVVAAADAIDVDLMSRHVRIEGARYPRLPDGYYEPGNKERNSRVECVLPNLPRFTLTLIRPDILAVTPERVTTNVEVTRDRVTFDRIRLDWPPENGERLSVTGFCYADFGRQVVYGEVRGHARQPHIRPMLVALDVPVAMPYFDGFTDVPRPVPSWCGWKVNLVNNDLDLYLDLHPTLGKYNQVAMASANGKIHLHVYTREDFLNYRQTFGPISAKGPGGKTLDGTVTVTGTNGYNTVEVEATSTLPIADLLRIAGFEDEYVKDDVAGNSKCRLQFRFPRAMTDDYRLLNGSGHVEIKGGRLMRMKGFRGLLDAMPSVAPAVSWFTDTTQAVSDFTIENGVVKTDNTYIEGSLFSIKMYGQFDVAENKLDYTVRVQFTKKDSIMGKLLHPLTWPFTKLLLEFRLTGAANDPKWEYVSVIDRVLEAVKK